MPLTPPTQTAVVSQLRSLMAVTDPELDTTVGSVIRKIFDVAAEVVSETYVDVYMMSYQRDLETRTGPDLDDYVGQFGFRRLPGTRATGVVVVERNNPDDISVFIPQGTEFLTSELPQVRFLSVVPVVMTAGATSIDVPVQAIRVGTQGNVEGNRVDQALGITGFDAVSNPVGMANGSDPESDRELRSRFRKTLFRSMAGTDDMYLGTALDNEFVSKATLIGATKRHREQIQIVAGAATSGLTDAQFIYPETDSLLSVDGQTVFTRDIHYTLSAANPPAITVINNIIVPDGLYLLEFSYSPEISRNDPTNGITNRVDVYTNGQRAVEATETVVFRTARTFNTTVGNALNRANFRRVDGSLPVAGNIFVGYGFTPVMQPSTTGEIVVDGVTFTEDVDYFLIHDVGPKGGGPATLSGVEWISTANGGVAQPADGAIFSLDYVYNQVPTIVENAIRRWRLSGRDVRAHEGLAVRLDVFLTIVPEEGFSKALIEASVRDALAAMINQLEFASIVQVSDLLNAAGNVSGVDEVRFTTDADDAVDYALQQVAADGTTVLVTHHVGGRAANVHLKTNEYALLNDLTVTLRAPGTFGTP